MSPSVIVCQLPPPPSHLVFPAVRQLQVSLSGKFYLQLNSAPPPAVAASTGSALLSAKQTVNSRSVPRGCDTSTTHRPNMFLHEARIGKKKGGFAAPVLQLKSRKGSCCWLSEHFSATFYIYHFTVEVKFCLTKYFLIMEFFSIISQLNSCQ